MMNNLMTLLRLEFLDVWGINKLKISHSKKDIFMVITYFIVALMMMTYIGLYCYGLAYLQLTSLIPAYLVVLTSMVVFFVSIMKTSSVLFQKKGYATLSCLPVSKWEIVCAKFIHLYVENLLFSSLLFIPGIVVYGLFTSVSLAIVLLVILSSTLVVMLISTLIGTLITYISSRLKHRTFVEIGLSIGIVLVVLLSSMLFHQIEGDLSIEMLNYLSVYMYELLGKGYPLSIYFGDIIVRGELMKATVTFIILLGMVYMILKGICHIYDSVMNRLSINLEMTQQAQSFESQSLMKALIKREFKRYFASSIYVTNTIIGPILSIVLSISLFFIDMNLEPFYPLMVVGTSVLMNPTAVSISMEGQQWWITKSLPITTRQCLASKIGMSFILYMPFIVIAEICLIFLIKPTLVQMICMLVFSIGLLSFSFVFGLFINMKFYQLNWDNEVSVVKQSFSAFLGGMGGMMITLISALLMYLLPQINPWSMQGIIGLILGIVSKFLFQEMCGVNLEVMVE